MRTTLLLVTAGLLATTGPAAAQAPSGAAPDELATVSSYDGMYNGLWVLQEDAGKGALVKGLTLVREGGAFRLDDGRLVLMRPLRGRVIAAVWSGTGRFAYSPADTNEARRLARFFGGKVAADVALKRVVFLFTDSTATELSGKVSLGPTEVTGVDFAGALDYIGDRDAHEIDPDLMRQLLNGTAEGTFIAIMERDGGSPIMFEVSAAEREGVRLAMKAKSSGGDGREMANVTQMPRAGEQEQAWRGNRRGDAHVRHSAIEVTLAHSSTGDLQFSARSRSTLWAPDPAGPWVPLDLYGKLKVESASWADGTPAIWYRGKDSNLLWVLLPRQLTAADSLQLDLAYAGDLTDRYGDFFFIKASTAWYPSSVDWQSRSTFDLTFRSPKGFGLASVGERRDSTVEGNMMVTKWVTTEPIRNASFNVGLFKPFQVDQSAPPVTVLWSPTGHAAIVRAMMANDMQVEQLSSPEKRVGGDVAASMRFYQSVFGPAPVRSFHATEIPAYHGEAFPGLVHLSYITFFSTARDGENEIFRAHEAAHQWWGIGVDYATYRDRWLSEGFANFSGLWYLQVSRKDAKPYFETLKRWKADILEHAAEAGPISEGHRVITDVEHINNYQAIVYEKGAWVLHMLRGLLLDTKTMNEDRFTAIMKDFYQTYQGQRATTGDFQRIVEKHVGQPMGWFFDQWVRGTAIPTYRPSWKIEPAGDGKYRVRLTVLQEGVPDSFMMYVPVTLEFPNGARARLRVLVKGPKSEPELPLLPAEPKNLVFNDFEGVLARVR